MNSGVGLIVGCIVGLLDTVGEAEGSTVAAEGVELVGETDGQTVNGFALGTVTPPTQVNPNKKHCFFWVGAPVGNSVAFTGSSETNLVGR